MISRSENWECDFAIDRLPFKFCKQRNNQLKSKHLRKLITSDYKGAKTRKYRILYSYPSRRFSYFRSLVINDETKNWSADEQIGRSSLFHILSRGDQLTFQYVVRSVVFDSLCSAIFLLFCLECFLIRSTRTKGQK